MQKHPLIEFEWGLGRSDEAVVRRMYSVEMPVALDNEREKLFDIIETCGALLGVSVMNIKAAGSAQTGFSFHNQRGFERGKSDLDLAIVSSEFFEKLLRAAQKAALPSPDTLERPRRNAFPEIRCQSAYAQFVENVALYGYILPMHLPACDEKTLVLRVARRLSEKYQTIFSNVNFAFYLSQHFFERKQMPNLGLYKRALGGG